MNTEIRGQRSGFRGQNCKLQIAECGQIHPSSFIPHPSSLRLRPGRRGVLLLIVLALLALFGMIAVAFVIVSGQAQRNAKIMQRLDQTLEPPGKILNEAMMQIARGPSNPVSVLGPHSLLEDMYGNTSRVGVIINSYIKIPQNYPLNPDLTTNINPAVFRATGPAGEPPVDGQVIQFMVPMQTAPPSTFAAPAPLLSGVPGTFSSCSGMVITFLNGPRTKGHSTRIVSYIPAVFSAGGGTLDSPDYFQIVATPEITVSNIRDDVNDLYANNQYERLYYIINGAPFSGTGFGFNPATGHLNLALNLDPNNLSNQNLTTTPSPTTFPAALLPNMPISAYISSPDPLIANAQGNPPGGANEDYDAADYQNLVLAAQITQAAPSNWTATLPSLHRPALVNYWYNRLVNDTSLNTSFWLDPTLTLTPAQKLEAILRPYGLDNKPNTTDDALNWPYNATVAQNIVNFKRRIMLRPLAEDNPDFSGGNLLFNPQWNGTFVDNNPVDGVCDYQWDVDNDGDGVADSIWVDLGMPVRAAKDGKLYKPLFAILCVDMDGRLNLNAHGSLAQTSTGYYQSPTLPSGVSYAGGSAPANNHRGEGYGPADINLNSILPIAPTNLYQQLLSGNTLIGIEGRYGQRQLPGIDHRDSLSANKWFNYDIFGNNYGDNYWNFSNANNAGAYGSPPDPFGVGIIGLDPAGRPLYVNMGGSIADNPYQIDLGLKAARGLINSNPTGTYQINNPFSVNELERILRPFDRDSANLPGRLSGLAPSLIQNRHAVTTESWDLPVPAVHQSLVDNLINDKGVPANQVPNLLPPEILAGLKMNLNRPFGDGRDSAIGGNGVVDEPGEPFDQLQLILQSGAAPSTLTGSFDPSGTVSDSLAARQLQARHLYILAMLLCDQTALQNRLSVGGVTATSADVARYLAQWAVNAVDFCDRDSIMTPFPYDVNPWDGWDEPPMTDIAHVVWGCERPELLITETLAFHDRRTENLDADGGKFPHDPGYPTDTHMDFDQVYRPQGSLFVELYNPWTSSEPKSGDLYDLPNGGVKLDMRDRQTNTSPVWRLLIVPATGDPANPTPEQPDPDDPNAQTFFNNTERREVYFVSQAVATNLPLITDPLKHTRYFSTLGPTLLGPTSNLMPGQYALIGPGEKTDDPTTHRASRTYIGTLTSGIYGDPNTRYIDMGGQPPNMVTQNATNNPADPPPGSVQQPIVKIRVDDPLRLSVSEPFQEVATLFGYDATAGQAVKPATEKYSAVFDQPFDILRTPPNDFGTANADGTCDVVVSEVLIKDQTWPMYRMAHLQRLANPLLRYDPVTNPYRTIDSMAIDLTAFNGVTNANDPNAVSNLATNFRTRQRGKFNSKLSSDAELDDNAETEYSLWKQEPPSRMSTLNAPLDIAGHYFNKGLKNSLGYLNQPFGAPSGTAPYVGDPQQPFSWLTWNNRPYVSALEMLLVPAEQSSKLLVKNEAIDPDTKQPLPLQYLHYRLLKSTDTVKPYNVTQLQDTPYPHLMNFFDSQLAGGAVAPELHRLLEYVGVPSRFACTEIQGNPTFMSGGNHWFHPPFNFIPTYREPGKINLNTIYDPQVFASLINQFPYPLYTNNIDIWSQFLTSRRGFFDVNPTTGRYEFNNHVLPQIQNISYPTEFGRPFRSAECSHLVPLNNLIPLREIDTTILRQGPADINAVDSPVPPSNYLIYDLDPTKNPGDQNDPSIPTTVPDTTIPIRPSLTPHPEIATFLSKKPLFNYESNNGSDNTDRNPFFRYQGLERLTNLVTTRSNVYSVWITVGYFEVKPHKDRTDPQYPNVQPIVDAAHPDGYELGQELGSDMGEIVRHRAFYMIDRTIPVGFVRGQDLNVEKAIILKRFIE